MFETILNYFDQLPPWLNAITALIAASSGITVLTPTKKDDKILNSVLSVLNLLALNVGKNKNADDK